LLQLVSLGAVIGVGDSSRLAADATQPSRHPPPEQALRCVLATSEPASRGHQPMGAGESTVGGEVLDIAVPSAALLRGSQIAPLEVEESPPGLPREPAAARYRDVSRKALAKRSCAFFEANGVRLDRRTGSSRCVSGTLVCEHPKTTGL